MCHMEEQLLQEYIEGSLLPLEKTILEEHLRHCDHCRKELNKLKIIDWDLRRAYQEELEIPAELSSLRENVLESCLAQAPCPTKQEKGITGKDIWQLQKNTLNNSVKFITLMAPNLRREQPAPKPHKKTSLFRKIIGL